MTDPKHEVDPEVPEDSTPVDPSVLPEVTDEAENDTVAAPKG